MPKFSYTVKNAQGRTSNGVEEAPDRLSLADRLQKQGFFVVNIEAVSDITTPKETSKPGTKPITRQRFKQKFTHDPVKLDDLLIFCHQLSTMLDSGINLLRSLRIISVQVESKKLSQVLDQVATDVEQGNPFSKSLAKHPKTFDQFWVSLAEVGEASGTMPTVLNKLAFYLERQAEFKASIVSAIIYPVILIFVSMGAVLFFAMYIGPKFKSLFDTFHTDLPLLTVTLLNIFDFIKSKFLMIITFIGVILFLLRGYVKTPAGCKQMEQIFLTIPKFGTVYKTIVVERFTSQMALLIESGVPILYSLDIAQRLIGNRTCEEIIGKIKDGVREGKLIAQPMSETDFFPPMTVQMIMVGEETGELAKMLHKVSEFYQASVQTFMKRFGAMFEPIMLVVMGAVIGTIVIAMFLPIFDISQMRASGS